MRALNRYVDQKRDELIALAVAATEHAELNPQDEEAQMNANTLVDAADAGRRMADLYRYSRAELSFGPAA